MNPYEAPVAKKDWELHYAAGPVVLSFVCWGVSQHMSVPSKLEVVMLVLKRRIGEEIILNDDVRIVVTQTTNGSCSLAIEAPDSYRIRRGELPAFSETIIHRIATALEVPQ